MAPVERKLYRVTLWLESPNTLTPPDEWDWNLIVNPANTKAREKAPVILYHSTEAELGTA